ncbi:hypothetical protein NEFER03_1570, partial [Nematocida sp. LUAm3]
MRSKDKRPNVILILGFVFVLAINAFIIYLAMPSSGAGKRKGGYSKRPIPDGSMSPVHGGSLQGVSAGVPEIQEQILQEVLPQKEEPFPKKEKQEPKKVEPFPKKVELLPKKSSPQEVLFLRKEEGYPSKSQSMAKVNNPIYTTVAVVDPETGKTYTLKRMKTANSLGHASFRTSSTANKVCTAAIRIVYSTVTVTSSVVVYSTVTVSSSAVVQPVETFTNSISSVVRPTGTVSPYSVTQSAASTSNDTSTIEMENDKVVSQKILVDPKRKEILKTILQKLKEKYPPSSNESIPYVDIPYNKIESYIEGKEKLDNNIIQEKITKSLEIVLNLSILQCIKESEEEKKIINSHRFKNYLFLDDELVHKIARYIFNSRKSSVIQLVPMHIASIEIPSDRYLQIYKYIKKDLPQNATDDEKILKEKFKEMMKMEYFIGNVLELGKIIMEVIEIPTVKDEIHSFFADWNDFYYYNITDQINNYRKFLPIAHLVQDTLKYESGTASIDNSTPSELLDSLDIAKTQLSIYNLRILGYIIYWELIYTNITSCYFEEVKSTAPHTNYRYIQYEVPEEFVMYYRSAHLPRIDVYNSIKATPQSANIQPDYRYNPFEATRVLTILLSENVNEFIYNDNPDLASKLRHLSYTLPAPLRVELIELIRDNEMLDAKLLIILHILSDNSTKSKLVSIWYRTRISNLLLNQTQESKNDYFNLNKGLKYTPLEDQKTQSTRMHSTTNPIVDSTTNIHSSNTPSTNPHNLPDVCLSNTPP